MGLVFVGLVISVFGLWCGIVHLLMLFDGFAVLWVGVWLLFCGGLCGVCCGWFGFVVVYFAFACCVLIVRSWVCGCGLVGYGRCYWFV